MPVRIYALAKELSLDSKDLVDLIKKAGITGKGSALASLSDDEEKQFREHLAGSAAAKPPAAATMTAASPAKAAAAPVAPVRDFNSAASRRPAAIPAARPKPNAESETSGASGPAVKPAGPLPVRTPKLAPPPAAEAPPEPKTASPKPEAPLTRRPAAAGPSSPALGKPSATPSGQGIGMGAAPDRPAATPAAASGSMASRIADRMGTNSSGRVVPNTPGSPIAPVRGGREGGAIRSLDRPAARGDGTAKPGDPKAKKREPRIKINLAQMPSAPEPVAPVSPTSGAAQKPDIKLTRDVIEGHKQGMKAPLERLEKDDAEKKRVKRAPVGTPPTGRKEVEDDENPRKKKGLAGMASARAERVRGGGGRRTAIGDSDRPQRRYRPKMKRKGTNTAAPRKEKVVIELPCTVRSFSEASGISIAQVMKTLMTLGMMVNINAELDFETAETIAAELEMDLELKASETLEDEVITQLEEQEDDPDSLLHRAPVVTFLGHVDHGKTSLLDYLIGINVVKSEAGGITQHIRAYEIDKGGRKITFVDTPGHEAFTEMRARGANVTDIAVLVVAADDGIMPQTEEAISHAKAAEVPIVVALNKCDLEGVDINRVMTQLTEHQLTPSEWGGDVEVVRTSALTGEGMDELLDTLLTVAELNEYVANPDRPALGVCLESQQHGDRGVIANMIVQNGTLKVGDILVCGPAHGRVRAMTDPLTRLPVTSAGPSTPVNLIGLDQPPGAGDRFHVLSDIGQAREIAASREHETRGAGLSGITTKVSFEKFQEMMSDGRLSQTGEAVKLNLIIRADARGSLEAIEKELSKFDHPEVELRVLQRSVGGITLADATLASASDAVILGFNVIPDEQARQLADQRGVEIRRYDVIYKLADEIKAMIEGRLKPEERVVELGRALVKQVFSISRVGTIAGCYVAQGSIQRNCRIRVNRDGRTIGDYQLDTLRRIKEDVKEVPRGMECGIRLANFNDIKQDDVLEAYKIEEVARTLD